MKPILDIRVGATIGLSTIFPLSVNASKGPVVIPEGSGQFSSNSRAIDFSAGATATATDSGAPFIVRHDPLLDLFEKWASRPNLVTDEMGEQFQRELSEERRIERNDS